MSTQPCDVIPQDRRHPRSIVGFAKRNLSITTTLHTSFTVNSQSLAPVLDDLYAISSPTACGSVPNTKLQLSFDAREKGKRRHEPHRILLRNDNPYLITTANKPIKICKHLAKKWLPDPQVHPILTIVVPGSEDERVRTWYANTYHLESALPRCVMLRWGTNKVVVGFYGGVVVRKLGRDEPLYL